MTFQKYLIASVLMLLAVLISAGCTAVSGTGFSSAAATAADRAADQNTLQQDQGTGGSSPSGSPPGGNSTFPSGGIGPGGSPPSGTPPSGIPPSGTPPAGSPPGGMIQDGNTSTPSGGMGPGGAPPGGSSGSSSSAVSGAFIADGITSAETDGLYTSDKTDVSAIYVTNGGDLTLNSPTIVTTGETSSNDASSFYGLNAAVLAGTGSKITINGGSITTSGSGANGAFPTGTGSSIALNGVTIKATGGGGHGVMATNGGTLTLTGVDISTTGANGAPLATDRGSGTVTATRGAILASGTDSPGIYSTGKITVSDATVTATGAEAAVIEGFNSISLHNTSLNGGIAKTGGIMIYQSMSGDAETGTGTFTMEGGSYTATAGPVFFVTNTNAIITLTGTSVTSVSDTLISAAGTRRWGTSGKNGGNVTFTADNEKLTGNIVTDSISSVAVTLKNGSSLAGKITTASLSLDRTSSWNVTGDSALASLSDTAGISGSSITNIYGNGHTVTYDTTLGANSALGGRTYTLANGGTLTPA